MLESFRVSVAELLITMLSRFLNFLVHLIVTYPPLKKVQTIDRASDQTY